MWFRLYRLQVQILSFKLYHKSLIAGTLRLPAIHEVVLIICIIADCCATCNFLSIPEFSRKRLLPASGTGIFTFYKVIWMGHSHLQLDEGASSVHLDHSVHCCHLDMFPGPVPSQIRPVLNCHSESLTAETELETAQGVKPGLTAEGCNGSSTTGVSCWQCNKTSQLEDVADDEFTCKLEFTFRENNLWPPSKFQPL